MEPKIVQDAKQTDYYNHWLQATEDEFMTFQDSKNGDILLTIFLPDFHQEKWFSKLKFDPSGQSKINKSL